MAAGHAGRPRRRSAAELVPVAQGIQSPGGPESHFRMKRQLRWRGHKAHVTETCDDMPQVIIDVTTCPSMRPGMMSTAAIHDRLAANPSESAQLPCVRE
jgi:transposase